LVSRHPVLFVIALLAVSVPLRAFATIVVPQLPQPPGLIVLAQEGGGEGGSGAGGGGGGEGGDGGSTDGDYGRTEDDSFNGSSGGPVTRDRNLSHNPHVLSEAPGVAEARRTLRLVQAAEGRFEARLARCGASDPLPVLHPCIANALDLYAKDLGDPRIVLPPETKAIPAIVAQTARRVRAATTHRQARAAVSAAVAEIRKSIALIKADEPVLARLETRAGTAVADGLQLADAKLEKAIGL
jgi:hypothetical protein